MKYNRALDLMAAAVEFHQAGKFNSAAKAMAAAVKDPSIKAALSIIESANSKAHAEMTASRKANRAASFDTAIDSDEPGEELREVIDENADRVIQEAGFGDDDEDGEDMKSAADDEDDDEEDEVEKAEAALKAAKAAKAAKASAKPVTSQARLAQAMKNFDKLK